MEGLLKGELEVIKFTKDAKAPEQIQREVGQIFTSLLCILYYYQPYNDGYPWRKFTKYTCIS